MVAGLRGVEALRLAVGHGDSVELALQRVRLQDHVLPGDRPRKVRRAGI